MTSLVIVNPTSGEIPLRRTQRAVVASLQGKTVGFLTNSKMNADKILEGVAEGLVARFGIIAAPLREARAVHRRGRGACSTRSPATARRPSSRCSTAARARRGPAPTWWSSRSAAWPCAAWRAISSTPSRARSSSHQGRRRSRAVRRRASGRRHSARGRQGEGRRRDARPGGRSRSPGHRRRRWRDERDAPSGLGPEGDRARRRRRRSSPSSSTRGDGPTACPSSSPPASASSASAPRPSTTPSTSSGRSRRAARRSRCDSSRPTRSWPAVSRATCRSSRPPSRR